MTTKKRCTIRLDQSILDKCDEIVTRHHSIYEYKWQTFLNDLLLESVNNSSMILKVLKKKEDENKQNLQRSK